MQRYSPTSVMIIDLVTAYLNESISFARTAIALVAETQFKNNQDGPFEVEYSNLFQVGDLEIEPLDLTDLPQLPTGYAALDNKAYRITMSTIVADTHTVRFAMPSVSEEELFKKLGIFHIDNDPFDPAWFVCGDVTVPKSAKAAPRVSTKTMYGESEGLGLTTRHWAAS